MSRKNSGNDSINWSRNNRFNDSSYFPESNGINWFGVLVMVAFVVIVVAIATVVVPVIGAEVLAQVSF